MRYAVIHLNSKRIINESVIIFVQAVVTKDRIGTSSWNRYISSSREDKSIHPRCSQNDLRKGESNNHTMPSWSEYIQESETDGRGNPKHTCPNQRN